MRWIGIGVMVGVLACAGQAQAQAVVGALCWTGSAWTQCLTDPVFGAASPSAGPAVGVRAETTTPTAVTDGQHIAAMGDVSGRAFTVPGATDNSTGAALRCTLVSAASTNATNCKASAGNIYGFRFINTTAALYYLRLYNLASAPTCSAATGFIESIPLPASATGGSFIAMEPTGEHYSTGIGFCLTAGSASTDVANAAVGVLGTILYK